MFPWDRKRKGPEAREGGSIGRASRSRQQRSYTSVEKKRFTDAHTGIRKKCFVERKKERGRARFALGTLFKFEAQEKIRPVER